MRTHLPNKLLDGLVDGIVVEVELRGDALRLVCECHAALVLGVEGTDELDLLLRLRANTRFLEDDWIPEGEGGNLFVDNSA